MTLAAYVPALNVAQAELRFLLGTQKTENTLYFVASGGMNSTLMNNLAAALESWWKTDLKTSAGSALVLNEIYITDLTTETSPTLSRAVTTANAGTAAGEALPNNVAYCISFRTGNRGRGGRGRNYLMGHTIDTVVSNTLESTIYTNYITAYGHLIGAGTFVSGLQWCIISRRLHNEPRTTALVQPVIAVIGVDQTMDSQRRRLPGRGR